MELPEECWELVFRFLINKNNNHRYLEPLSLVSKQFLSITNRLIFSLTFIFNPSLFFRFPSLTSLDLTRFRGDLNALLIQISNFSFPLKSLNLSHHSSIPADGLRSLAKKITTFTSLTFSNMGSLTDADLFLIAECFPFLEQLDLSFPQTYDFNYLNSLKGPVSDVGVKALSLALPKLRKINLAGNYFLNDPSLFSLCKNCEFLEDVVIFDCHFISQFGIASAIRERPGLRSLSVNNFGCGTKMGDFAKPHVTSDFIASLVGLKGLTCLDLSNSSISDELLCCIADEGLPLRKLVLQGCCDYSYAGIFYFLSRCPFVQHLDFENSMFLNDQHVEELSVFLGNLVSINVNGCRKLTDSALFALARNCSLLNEIKMEATEVGRYEVEVSLMGGVVNSQVKSLHLAHNSWLRDEIIEIFASIYPNLQLLDLRNCGGISEGIVEVLGRCCEIRHLSLAFCSSVKLVRLNFQVPKLEVLNLSRSLIDDETLSVISKCCRGLLKLDLDNCSYVTAKGVRQVVESCTQLREINLGSCCNVSASVVAWMVFSRPSLRKVMVPPSFDLSGGQKEILLRHGCLVCY